MVIACVRCTRLVLPASSYALISSQPVRVGRRAVGKRRESVLDETAEAMTMKRKGKKSKGTAAGGDRYDVTLTGGGDQRLAVAKVFNEISGMKRVGAELQEIFSRPTAIKQGVNKDEAAKIKRRIEDAGGSVRITPARG